MMMVVVENGDERIDGDDDNDGEDEDCDASAGEHRRNHHGYCDDGVGKLTCQQGVAINITMGT